MSLTKHAEFKVLAARIAPEGGGPLMRTAHRHEFQYEPRPGYLYVRSRAISSRTNDNFDNFPGEEIKKAYATFVGKPVFVNHHNDNHRRARGVIKDAVLHEDVNPDGSEDTWCEVLMEVDAVRFPKLAKAILDGDIDRTSMGTDVQFSVCSVCNNRAASPVDYCKHIPKMKGQKVWRTTASGEKEGILVYEKCYGLGFFENSLLVEEPADPTAYFLGVDARGLAKAAAKQPFVKGHEMAYSPKPGPNGKFRGGCTCGRPFPERGTVGEAYIDTLNHVTRGNPDYDDNDINDRERALHNKPPVERVKPGTHDILPANYNEWTGTNPENWELVASVQTDRVVDTALAGHLMEDHAMSWGEASGGGIDWMAQLHDLKHQHGLADHVHFVNTLEPWRQNDLAFASSRRTAADEKTLAPADVDTLRDENCPVCGESSAFDGDKCQVCGFISPPSEFGDPDTDQAKATDLRQQDDDSKDKGGDLACDSCGATFASEGHGKTALVLDPEKGTESGDDAASVEAKAGDSCPTCGEGTLQPAAPDAAAEAAPGADEDGFAPAGSAEGPAPEDPDSDEEDDAGDEDGADGPDVEDGEDGDKPDFLKNKKKKPTANRRRVQHDEGAARSVYAPSHDLGDGRDHRMLAVAGASAAERLRDDVRAPSGVRVSGGSDPARTGRGSRLGSGLSAPELREPGTPRSHHAAGERAAHEASSARNALPTGSRLHTGEHQGEVGRRRQGVQDMPHRVHGAVSAEEVTSHHSVQEQKEQSMRPALAALAAQQKQIDGLKSALAFVADVAGISQHPRITSALKATAVDENPAFGGGWENMEQAGTAAPVVTTEQAATPTAKDDVEAIGSTPLTDVTPDAQTDLADTGVVLDVTEPTKDDVTAEVAGTDTLGKGEAGGAGTNRVETEVRVGNPSDNSAAFRDGGFLGSKGEARTIASLRLARLQVQAGIAAGDDLDLSQVIAASDRSDESIQTEIATLSKVVTATRQPQRVARNLVPQGARQAQRMVPSMTETGLTAEGSLGSISGDEMAFE